MAYRIYLCGVDERLVTDMCPGRHTPAPLGYLEWHSWAEEMSKTHRSTRCSVCGLYAVWVRKAKKVKK